MQKIRKILRAVSEKTALPTNQPTNQPTNYYLEHRSYSTSLTPIQKFLHKYLFKIPLLREIDNATFYFFNF